MSSASNGCKMSDYVLLKQLKFSLLLRTNKTGRD